MSLCTALSPYFPPMAPKGPCPGALGPLPRTPRALGQEKILRIREIREIRENREFENVFFCETLRINTSSKKIDKFEKFENSRIFENYVSPFSFQGPLFGSPETSLALAQDLYSSKFRELVSGLLPQACPMPVFGDAPDVLVGHMMPLWDLLGP